MKKLLLLLLLVGCDKPPNTKPTVCYQLDMCEVTIHGYADGHSPDFIVYCIYGYDADGKMTGDIKRFFARDALNAWSILHSEAKPCDEVKVP